MFDFAWSELGLIALVSVLVLGPKQLPETMRTMAKVLRRVRSLGAEFQGHVNEMIREAELEDLRNQVQKLSTTSVSAEVGKIIDPHGDLTGHLQIEPPAGLQTTEAPDAAQTPPPELYPTDSSALSAPPEGTPPAAAPAVEPVPAPASAPTSVEPQIPPAPPRP